MNEDNLTVQHKTDLDSKGQILLNFPKPLSPVHL